MKKEAVLPSELTVTLRPLRLRQGEEFDERVADGKRKEASMHAILDALNNAGSNISMEELREFEIPDIAELFRLVCEITGIDTTGEAKADR